MSSEEDPIACVKAHIAQYVGHPSREHYFKVKDPFRKSVRRQQSIKRPSTQISTDGHGTLEPGPALCSVSQKTLHLYRTEVIHASQNSERAKELFSQTAALECRHLQITATDVAWNGGDAAPSPEDEVSLADFLFSPSLPWSGGLGRNLVTLDLEQNALGDLGVERLCTVVLPFTKGLQRLLLASNQIRRAGWAHLCTFLLQHASEEGKALPHLATLGLTNNDVGEDSNASATPVSFSPGKSLAQVLLLYKSTVRRLHLNHVGFKSQDVVDLLLTLFPEGESAMGPEKLLRFETVYLKQNDATNLKEIEECLDKLAPSTARSCFLSKHVLL